MYERPVHLTLNAKEIRPELKLMSRIACIVRQELSNQGRVLVRFLRYEKLIGLIDRRHSSHDREVGATQKLLVGNRRVRLHSLRFQVSENEIVDLFGSLLVVDLFANGMGA